MSLLWKLAGLIVASALALLMTFGLAWAGVPFPAAFVVAVVVAAGALYAPEVRRGSRRSSPGGGLLDT